jgi:hypothetical protein
MVIYRHENQFSNKTLSKAAPAKEILIADFIFRIKVYSCKKHVGNYHYARSVIARRRPKKERKRRLQNGSLTSDHGGLKQT